MATAVPAAAQNEAKADAEFKLARRLLRQGKVAEACTRFEASLALDPALGTRLNLADCYARLGRTATAWALFVEVAEKDTKRARVAEARRRAAALEKKLPRLTITTAEADPDLRVTRDGQDITGMYGVALPVDPGNHVVAASWKGQEWSTEVTVQAGRRAEVAVPRFWTEPPAPPAATAPAEPRPAQPASARAPLAPTAPAPRGGKDRTWAWVTGGVGVAAIATGLVFGGIAKSRWDDSEKLGCHDEDGERVCPTHEAAEKARSAKTPSTLSTVFVVAGGVALVGAGVLWFTAPEKERAVTVVPAAAPREVGVVVNGRF